MNMKHLARAAALFFALSAGAHAADRFDDKFRQLDELLPTPSATRTASGAPGHAYWQQRADYRLRATLDEDRRAITGSGTVTYTNNSPDTLSYLWVQLDQNMFRGDSDNRNISTIPSRDAWQKGAQSLTAGERQNLANDPLNLIAADGPANQDKGAGDAATWLPKNKSIRCHYVARQVSVKAAYGLWVTEAERDAMKRVLGSCPGQQTVAAR